MPGIAVVAQHRGPALIIGVDHVKVPVAIQVPEGRAKADPPLVQAPGRPGFLKVQVAQVAVGQVDLGQRQARFHLAHPLRGALGQNDAVPQVRVLIFTVHAVGHEEVEPPVVVEVLEPHRPGPVRRRQPREVGRLQAAPGTRVQEEGVVGILRHALLDGIERPRIGHAAMVLLMRARGHVRDEQVQPAVVVDVTEIRAHRGIGNVGDHLADDVRERAVAVVVVEAVGADKVVGHIEVGPAVAVVVPPGGRVRE